MKNQKLLSVILALALFMGASCVSAQSYTFPTWDQIKNKPTNSSYSFNLLSDTPGRTGNAGKALKVNLAENGYEWGNAVSTFESLTDVATRTGQAGKVWAVNASETGYEWIGSSTTTLPELLPNVRVLAYTGTAYVEDLFVDVGGTAEATASMPIEIVDTHNAWNVDTFTAPFAGKYAITFNFAHNATSAAGLFDSTKIRASLHLLDLAAVRSNHSNHLNSLNSVSTVATLAAGETVRCLVGVNVSTDTMVSASTSISIEQIH